MVTAAPVSLGIAHVSVMMAYAISEVEEADWRPVGKLLHRPLIQRHVLFGGLDGEAGMQRRRGPDDEFAAEFAFG